MFSSFLFFSYTYSWSVARVVTMAPNIKKLKVLSDHRDGTAAPDYPGTIDAAADLETGSFLTENQRNNNVNKKPAENPYLDEYRA